MENFIVASQHSYFHFYGYSCNYCAHNAIKLMCEERGIFFLHDFFAASLLLSNKEKPTAIFRIEGCRSRARSFSYRRLTFFSCRNFFPLFLTVNKERCILLAHIRVRTLIFPPIYINIYIYMYRGRDM